jgi:hypothetical protein
MKKLFLFIFLVNALNAKGQSFSEVQGFLPDIVLHSTSYTGGKASIGKMAFDSANNKYILGWFDGIMDLDPGPNIQCDTSFGHGNLFILKEDAAGNFVWAKQFTALSPSAYTLGGTEIDVDASGNVYIAGSIRDSVDMDPGPGFYSLSARGGGVGFILKLDAAGNFVWAKGHEADTITHWSFINGMKLIGGAIYATAAFVGTVDLDPGPGIFNVTAPSGERSMLLIKMDTAGNFIWGKPISGKGIDYLNSFTADGAANLYITGGFQDTVDFDPGPGTYKLAATPWKPGIPFGYNSDVFIAKYDSAGKIAWAHSFGGHYRDEGKGIAVDRFGNIFVSGQYEANGGTELIDFDPGPGVSTLYEYWHDFLLKLRGNGDFAWVKNTGGAIATDDTGNVYVGATQKFDSSGDSVWTGRWVASGGSTPQFAWMGLDKKDILYVTGTFSGRADFDPSPSTFYLSCLPYAAQSGFILKLNQIPNPWVPWTPYGINPAIQHMDVSVYPNPSSGIVTFSSPSAIRRIEVTDMAGKVVYINKPNKSKTLIDLVGEAAGVYFYQIESDAGIQRGKLVIY